MKTRKESGQPQASAEGLSETTRRELKRQLDSCVGDLAREVLREGGDSRDDPGIAERGGR